MADSLLAKGWPGVERYFDWSFYSQGSRENSQSSADLFLRTALAFFGVAEAEIPLDATERGQLLAAKVKEQRTLLILDGLEPLQFPHSEKAHRPGQFKDEGLRALLDSLAMGQPGLTILTSRESIADLAAYREGVCPEHQLDELAIPAAIRLLRALGVQGTDAELETACKKVCGHALTLQMLGRFLVDAHQGDIARRDRVDWVEADANFPYRGFST